LKTPKQQWPRLQELKENLSRALHLQQQHKQHLHQQRRRHLSQEEFKA
jgi:hypothetical protein